MSRPTTTTSVRTSLPRADATASGWAWISNVALVIAVALVVARMLLSESIRTPLDIAAGGVAAPLSPGAATGLVLDLLMIIPALLVLARRLFDSEYTLAISWACVPMGCLGIWAMASTLWSADRFAAAISSFHLLSAFVSLWSIIQLVRLPVHLRLVGGTCFGMLLILSVSGYLFRWIDAPQLRQMWNQQQAEILQSHHWLPGSFAALQFEKRVTGEEPMGFSVSPNSYAALLVMLASISAGIMIQGVVDGDGPLKTILIGAGIAGSLFPLAWTHSRAAGATFVFGALLLVFIYGMRTWLARNARRVFAGTLVVLLLGACALVGYGLTHGNLIQISLTFRWWYWVGGWRMLMSHPVLGVGWENFGPHYVSVRLLTASEEVRDPHNFIVRFFSELGVVGGVLLIGWMARLWWEMTVCEHEKIPSLPASRPAPARRGVFTWLLAPAVGGILINMVASIDFTTESGYVLLEVVRRAAYLLLLLAGLAAALVQIHLVRRADTGAAEIELLIDERPAEWIRRAIIVGLATFLIQNLIEFSLFEPGPLFLFALLAGAATAGKMADHKSRPFRRATIATILLAAIGMIVAATTLLVVPVCTAEALAHEADTALIRDNPGKAERLLSAAHAQVPWNGDYAARAARAALAVQPPDLRFATSLLDAAIAADPLMPDSYLTRAQIELAEAGGERAAFADYQRALGIDPNNVSLRLQFAGILAAHDHPEWALAEYREALRRNDALLPDEPKRLDPKTERKQVEAAIARLEGQITGTTKAASRAKSALP